MKSVWYVDKLYTEMFLSARLVMIDLVVIVRPELLSASTKLGMASRASQTVDCTISSALEGSSTGKEKMRDTSVILKLNIKMTEL